MLVYAASLGAVLVPALAAAAGAVLPALLAGSGMFGAAGVWGYVTHSDMRPLGTALFMGVVGLFIALIGNGLLAHAALSFRISAAGVLLFSGLTAYDIRRIGASAHRRIGASAHRRIGVYGGGGAAILGALALYLDFLNLFLLALQFMTGRRR